MKVLKCELSDEQINLFSNRQSAPLAIDFLRYLRSKLPAFEPVYLSELIELEEQQKKAAFLLSTNKEIVEKEQFLPISHKKYQTQVPGHTLEIGAGVAVAATAGGSVINRRPSMFQTEKILKE